MNAVIRRAWTAFFLTLFFVGAVGAIYWLQSSGIITLNGTTVAFLGFAAAVFLWLCAAILKTQGRIGQLDEAYRAIDNGVGGDTELDDFQSELAARTSGTGPVQPTKRARHYTTDDVLQEVGSWSRVALEQSPALFTALGILFTFAGLIYGLESSDLTKALFGQRQDVEVGQTTNTTRTPNNKEGQIADRGEPNSEDSANTASKKQAPIAFTDNQDDVESGLAAAPAHSQAQKAFENLYSGIAVAFQSSFAGILLSFFALVAVKLSRESISQRCHAIRKAAGEEHKDDNPEAVLRDVRTALHRVRDVTENQDQKLASLSTDIRDALDEKIGAPLDELNDKFKMFTDQQLETHSEMLEDVLEDFNSEFSETLGDRFNKLDDVLMHVIEWHERTQEMHQETLDRIDKQLDIQDEHLADRRKALQSHRMLLSRTQTGMQEMLGETRHTLEKFQPVAEQLNETADRWEPMAEQLESAHQNLDRSIQSVEATFEALETSVSEQSDKVDQNLERFRTSFESSIADMLNAMDSTAKQLEESIGHATEEMNSSLEASMREMRQLLDSIENELKGLPGQYENVIERIRQKLSEGVEDTFEEFDKQTAEIVDHLNGTYANIERTLSKLDKSVDQLNTGVQRLNEWRERQRAEGGGDSRSPSQGARDHHQRHSGEASAE
jgi:DNA anti-recombination protein RmuC